MNFLTLEEQRQRIENVNAAAIGNRKYLRRKRIHDYLPGQAVYNLGDYPAPFSIAPTDYDREMLRDMAANGVELAGKVEILLLSLPLLSEVLELAKKLLGAVGSS